MQRASSLAASESRIGKEGASAGIGTDSAQVILRAFAANLGIAMAKMIAAVITGSSAMLTEGVHSLIDSINQVLLWVGEKRAARPADDVHPMGYGRELYFWSVVVAILIFGLGAGFSAYEGAVHIVTPEPTRQPLIAYAVLLVALLLEGWSLHAAYRAFERQRSEGSSFWDAIRNTKDTTSLVVLLEDSAAVCGVLVAAAGIGLELLTGNAVWDGIASLGISAVLAFVAITLLREAKGLLIGESADPHLVAALRTAASEAQGVTGVEDVLTIHLGPNQVVAVIDVNYANDLQVAEMERLIARLEQHLCRRFAAIERIYLRPVGGGLADPAH